MKVATEPLALLLAGRDEAQSGGLQFGGELPGPHRDRRLAGQVVQERCVAGGERAPGWEIYDQVADVLTAVHQRHPDKC